MDSGRSDAAAPPDSATVAMTTAAGIVAPIALQTPGVSPELLAIATGAGSLIFSHVNDGGFWLVKEYLNLSVTETMKSWSICETIISLAGIGLRAACLPRYLIQVLDAATAISCPEARQIISDSRFIQ